MTPPIQVIDRDGPWAYHYCGDVDELCEFIEDVNTEIQPDGVRFPNLNLIVYNGCWVVKRPHEFEVMSDTLFHICYEVCKPVTRLIFTFAQKTDLRNKYCIVHGNGIDDICEKLARNVTTPFCNWYETEEDAGVEEFNLTLLKEIS